MNWQDLGGALIKAGAPILGNALGGPLGGMIGDAIGGVLANALGVEATPEAVDHAINTTPAGELAAKLSAAEAEAVAMWQALPKIAKAHAEAAATVNDTMRAELAAGRPWHHWRNLWGYSCVAQVSVASALFAWFMASGNWQAMNALAQHSGMLLTYFGMQLSVLGVVTNASAREKTTAVTGQLAPSVIEQIVKAVRKK
ncbi:MAG: hypothetical protein ACXWVL_07080 [Rhodoplanes sp.]